MWNIISKAANAGARRVASEFGIVLDPEASTFSRIRGQLNARENAHEAREYANQQQFQAPPEDEQDSTSEPESESWLDRLLDH